MLATLRNRINLHAKSPKIKESLVVRYIGWRCPPSSHARVKLISISH